MKYLSILAVAFLLSFHATHAQERLMIDENTLIKNEAGEKVSLDTFINRMNTGEWTVKPATDKDGKSFMKLIKLTEKQKVEMAAFKAEMPEPFQGEIPAFNLTDSNGTKLTKASTNGKVVVLNFWFTACKPCIQEIPELNKVYSKYKNHKDVVFAAVTFEKEESVAKFVSKYKLQYPTVSNANSFAKTVTGGTYPTNLIIDKTGNVSDSLIGGTPEIAQYIENAIEKALSK